MVPVRFERVSRSFAGVPAVCELDLVLAPGRVFGLLGPNGAGKSTTTRLILGWTAPDRGRVELFGRPPDDAGRARVGWVPEQRALPSHVSAREVLSFHARLRGRSAADAQSVAQHWCERLDLPADRPYVNDLSNGQQQRVQLGIAFLAEPELLLLDEPLTALDPVHQAAAADLMREAARRGACVLVATHRLREAEAFVDHVLLLHGGVKRLDRDLREALREASENTWRIQARDLSFVAGPDVLAVEPDGAGVRARLAPGAELSALLHRAAAMDAGITAIEAVTPSLHDLYLRVVA